MDEFLGRLFTATQAKRQRLRTDTLFSDPRGSSRFLAASERLDSFVFGQAQTIVLMCGNAIIVFRLLPTLAGLVFKERRLASLRAVMVETIELYGEFRGT